MYMFIVISVFPLSFCVLYEQPCQCPTKPSRPEKQRHLPLEATDALRQDQWASAEPDMFRVSHVPTKKKTRCGDFQINPVQLLTYRKLPIKSHESKLIQIIRLRLYIFCFTIRFDPPIWGVKTVVQC